MQGLLDAVVDLVTLVSPARVRSIAAGLRQLTVGEGTPASDALAGTPAARAAVHGVLAAWSESGVTGEEVAGMLLGASEAHQRFQREQSVELVWTGPTTRFVPTRRTEQVLLDLIASAKTDLFLVSFVVYDVPSVVVAMNEAVARRVRTRVLVEASSLHGGSLSVDPAATMRASIPGAEIFAWRDREAPFIDGKVHAKVAVVDAAGAFITSANLTGHALEKNMEAGVLVNGGAVPKALADHLQALIDVGVIGRV